MPPPTKKSKRAPKPGTIQFISVKNFMSYSYAELTPGKKFNVILGPNGSGKSSIVTAITVGLGGDLKLLKRQKELKDLVNKNCEEDDAAEIIIKLHKGEFNDEGIPKIDEIKCRITKQMKRAADYWKNNKRVDIQEIIHLARNYKIQTDNLCQFLPQDVVREFPEMNPQTIFHNTLKAVGNTEMLELHEGLAEKQKKKIKMEEMLGNYSFHTFLFSIIYVL